ncbi:unnamed protein product [Linum tenue]|uniref:Uncharacterized protein n=1 Tax=Linum tenue TaxID=586396 RepID=A0AAV0PQE1_9ROSI|nr:unnamed protein product [Linum tenue]
MVSSRDRFRFSSIEIGRFELVMCIGKLILRLTSLLIGVTLLILAHIDSMCATLSWVDGFCTISWALLTIVRLFL